LNRYPTTLGGELLAKLMTIAVLPLRLWRATHPAGPAGVPASFVVVRLDGTVQRMPVDEAWRRTPPEPQRNTEPTDDVWAIGTCSR
jgi:hypothetical protein